MSDDSNIHYRKDGNPVCFSGKDGVDYYAGTLLWSHIKLYKATGMIPTRGFGITKMLDRASYFTGQKYKRKDIDKAIEDLRIWSVTMKAALPTTVDE